MNSIQKNTVELQLSELMGTGTHSDNRSFFKKIAIGEKKSYVLILHYFFIELNERNMIFSHVLNINKMYLCTSLEIKIIVFQISPSM